MTHADDLLPERALGLLEGAALQSVDQHIASCERCRTRLEELGGAMAPVSESNVPTAPPIGAVRLSLRRAPPRFLAFEQDLARMLDLPAARTRALLTMMDDPGVWDRSPVGRLRAFRVVGGPLLQRARALLVHLPAGERLPLYHHATEEQVLLLQGRLRELEYRAAGQATRRGREWTRGQLAIYPAGSAHSAQAVGSEDCYCCVVARDYEALAAAS